MKVVLRVDASTEIGLGHLARCMTLAETLRARGADIEFVCRQQPGHQGSLLSGAGLPMRALPVAAVSDRLAEPGYGRWLGVSQEEDAEQTLRALPAEAPEWLVVDHYALDARWEQRLRPRVQRLMVIDDLADRPHECELLLDQNWSPLLQERYARLTPAHCERLLGVRFALIRPEYAQLRHAQVRVQRPIERVFVFFGGSDPHNLTGRALSALSAPGLRHLQVDVVIGANYRHADELAQQAAARPGTTLYGARKHLADLMGKADLAIGAGGTTTWERMCIGLPALVVSVAQNQEPVAEALAQQSLISYLGRAADTGVERIAAAVHQALREPAQFREQARRGRLLVDGLGVLRVAEALDPTLTTQLNLRRAQPQDGELYFAWVNDPRVRQQSLSSAAIAWEPHQRWYRAKLADQGAHMFVLEARSLPVGQVRFDQDGEQVRIDYSIDIQFRGRGWGRLLVALGMQRMIELGHCLFRAEVMAANAASLAIFQRLNFRRGEGAGLLQCFVYDARTQDLPRTH